MNNFSEKNQRPILNTLSRGIFCALVAGGMFAVDGSALAASAPESARVAATAINLAYQGKTLGSVVDDIKRQSGIEFKLPAELSNDLVNRSANANTWADAVKSVLSGYSYLGQSGDNGKLNQVIITGRNGDGSDMASKSVKPLAVGSKPSDMLAYQPNPKNLPAKYQGLTSGSVSLVSIPFDQLAKVKLGEKVPLSLPTGQYDVVHDNAFEHKNGDKTWIGYLDQEGKEYRVIVTSGKDGGMGQILTPNGEYQIELENGANYLVNVNAAGLTHGSLEDDQAVEDPYAYNPLDTGFESQESGIGLLPGGNGLNTGAAGAGEVLRGNNGAAARPTRQQDTTTTTDTTATAATTDTTTTTGACDITGPIIVNGIDKCSTVVPSVIDVLVVYTPGMDTTGLDTRLNQLVALTNQAYIDSKIVMSIRLVGKQLVSYTETSSNTTALSNLTYGAGAFSGIPALRTATGADLVALIRPFYYTQQLNCGYAWINGSNGTSLTASKGFAAISDGTDRGGSGYYCNNYTFAHELGHTMGNVHERGTNAPTAGAYPFSYGWGVSGTVGTIMSYLRPLVATFANPKVLCSGLACGVPTTEANSADNAATTNLTGNKVANFKATVVP